MFFGGNIKKKRRLGDGVYVWKMRIFLLFGERYFEAGLALYDEHAFLCVAAADEQLDADQFGAAIGLVMMMQSDTEYSASGEFSSVIGVAQ